MEATGARLIRGEGTLIDLRTVTVAQEQLIARRAVVIANGSTAAIPPIPGLDTVDFWTNRQAAIPIELPASLAILGAGAIGVELGQAFARLGSRVTLIEAGATFLGLEEPEAGAALRPHLEADGITLMIGDPCVAVERQFPDPSPRRAALVIRLESGALLPADRLLVYEVSQGWEPLCGFLGVTVPAEPFPHLVMNIAEVAQVMARSGWTPGQGFRIPDSKPDRDPTPPRLDTP